MSPAHLPRNSARPRARSPRLPFIFLALLALGATLSACSSSPTSGSTTSQSRSSRSSGSTITIQNFAFSPGTLRVAPGAQVSVTNKDNVAHTVSSTTGAFDTGDVQGGTSTHFTAPKKPGTYPYRCDIHQFMTGTLIVT